MRNWFCAVLTTSVLSCTAHEQGEQNAKSSSAIAQVRHFDPVILGTDVRDEVQPLKPATTASVEPISVQLDKQGGKYIAATLRYPKKAGFENMRRSLNAHYGRFENPGFAKNPTMGLWRNHDKRFAIQLTQDQKALVVIYIGFQSTDQVLKNVLKSSEFRQSQ